MIMTFLGHTIQLLWLQRCRDVELTAEAMEAIGDYYAELRAESATGALPVTVRAAGILPWIVAAIQETTSRRSAMARCGERHGTMVEHARAEGHGRSSLAPCCVSCCDHKLAWPT